MGPVPSTRFIPRITLTLLLGFGIFIASALLYVLPILVEPQPAGAIRDYTKERVTARLEGKARWFLGGSLIAATLLVSGMGQLRARKRR